MKREEDEPNFEHLSDLQKAQLLWCRPELRKEEKEEEKRRSNGD